MIRHETTIQLDRSAEQVFEFLVDPRKLKMWQSNLVKMEPLTEGPMRAGSRFREVRVLGRKQSEIQSEISAFEPGRRLATKTLTQPDVTVSYSLDPQGTGTRLHYQFAMRTTGLMRLMEPMIQGSIRKESESDFGKLKQLLEA